MKILPLRGRLLTKLSVGFLVLGAGILAAVPSNGDVSGNIAPSSIEIDDPSANVFPGDSTKNCTTANFAGTTLDWVKDCLANNDTPSVTDSVATGINPGVTGKAGGTGHWNGVRIVDTLAGGEQDQFVKGGKENDLTTWNVAPGSIGSAKYDATQAYLANNLEHLYFGMERAGNDGTTAFDFEFNQNAPHTTGSYKPNRTKDDALFTFEMQGSGGASGSAVVHYYKWVPTTTGATDPTDDVGSYVEQTTLPAGVLATIVGNASTPAPPWGAVNARGDWAGGNYQLRAFAEAQVPLSLLPGVNSCGGNAYAQVRTRSSSTATSDLKDTTKIFRYNFGTPTATATLSTGCTQQFTYGGTGSAANGQPLTSYSWSIDVDPATATLSGGGVSSTTTPGHYTSTVSGGTVDVTLPAGVASAVITVNNTTGTGSCSASSGNKTVTVYRELGATSTLTPQCNNHFAYASTVSGGNAPYGYAWSFQKSSVVGGVTTWTEVGTSTLSSGTFDASSNGAGSYRGVLTVHDTAATDDGDATTTEKAQCSTTAISNTVNVYDAVGGTVSLTPDCDNTFGYSATGSGGNGPYTFAFTLQKLVGTTWTDAKSFSGGAAAASASGTLDIGDTSMTVNGPGSYRLKVTITDSQGLNCHVDLTSSPVDIANQLTASAVKTSANGTALSVLLTGDTASGADKQWQRYNGTSWVDIAGANGTTLTYSSFAADATPSSVSFSIGSDSYEGQQYTVQLRLHASRTLNGTVCPANSGAVTVKEVIAVDP